MDTFVTTKATLRLRPMALVWLLGVSQILGYGTLYYSFSIMAGDIAGAFGWPVAWLYGSFSVALLAGGAIAPLVGKRIDRHGAGAVMAVGSGLSALMLLAAAVAPNAILFTLAMVGMQAAASLVLYDAAFAALVQATGSEARLRITHLTLIAGFASTIFWPVTSWLHVVLGWREILVVFAAANLLICLPIHLLMAAQHQRRITPVGVPDGAPVGETLVPAHQHRLVLWLVTIGFALAGFSLSAILAQMVPLLTAAGVGGSALLVSALFGPAQVTVRFVNMLLGIRRHPMAATLVALGLLPVAIGALLVSAPLTVGAICFAVLLGFTSGLKSIVQGTLPLALFGSASYGARLGNMAAVRQSLAAVSPFVLALLLENFGPAVALLVLGGVAGAGLVALLVVAWITRPRQAARSQDD